MITSIKVDGFKSLSDFSLDLKQGANILVGPNGVGKTNIINFFELLANSAQCDLLTAVSHSGGAGAVFQKIGSRQYAKKISATILGFKKMEETLHNKSGVGYVYYEYSFVVEISKESLFYREQILRARFFQEKLKEVNWQEIGAKWDLNIRIFKNIQHEKENQGYGIDILAMGPVNEQFVSSDNQDSEKNKSEKERIKGKILKRYQFGDQSLPRILYFVLAQGDDMAYAVVRDLTEGEAFNIIPENVKKREDVTSRRSIRRDGSGLASVFYQYKKMKQKNKQKIGKIDRIIEHIKLANENVADVEVNVDSFNNALRMKITMISGEFKSILPLSLLSDGTIKWMALMTAIFTGDLFSLEEPENYLHPSMQAEALKVIRQQYAPSSDKCALLTTHSETLLNAAQPEEIIVVTMKNGKTKASRVANAEELRVQISKTGFGLGYFYNAGALENE